MDNSLLAEALRYAAAGWPVFPCLPGSKVPRYVSPHRGDGSTCRGGCGRWGHGVLDATTDPETIRRWWCVTPAANVGVATGMPGPDVVDFDVKAGRAGARSLAQLRDAGLLTGALATVVTPSSGLHVYFAGSEQPNGSMPRSGVDFRSRGGYVLAPPSMVEGSAYRLVGRRPTAARVDFDVIRRFLEPPRPVPRPRPGGTAGHQALVDWVAAQGEGNRNNGLFWAARRAAEIGAADQVYRALVAAAVSAGLPELEAARTVRSARRATGGA